MLLGNDAAHVEAKTYLQAGVHARLRGSSSEGEMTKSPSDPNGQDDAAKQSEVVRKCLAKLEVFVTRARRVEEHSLAADKERLLRWASGTMKIRTIGKQTLLVLDLPDEETFDSLASRCRPFILKGDPIQWGSVLNAAKFFVRDDQELIDGIAMLKTSWRKLEPGTDSMLGYSSMIGMAGGLLGDEVTDKDLAYAWLYGDLIHADANVVDRVGLHDIDSRFQGGVLLIANVAVAVITTLNLVRAAYHRGLIPLGQDTFTRRVNARSSVELPVTGMVIAPVGTSQADLRAAIDGVPEA